jgi:flagellar FliL protein
MAAKKETKAPTDAVPAEGGEPAAKKSKMPMIAILAVGLAVGGGTGAAVIGPMVAKKLGKASPAHAEAGKDSASGKDEKAAEGEKPKEGEKAKEGEKGKEGAGSPMHLLENLVLNPAGSGGSRFLLLSVAIETGNKTAEDDFKARDAELRDIILTSLGNKNVDQLVDMANREAIKVEVQSAIGARFGKTAVKRLYFPQFVVQ